MKLTSEQMKSQNQFSDKIDELELSLLQKAFLKDIHFINLAYGKYKFIKGFAEEKYKEVASPDDLFFAIAELIELGILNKEVKRSIYNGKYVTLIYFHINQHNLILA